jgi:hypothetical protein
VIILPLFLISLLFSATASVNATELDQIIKNEKVIIQELNNLNNAFDRLSALHDEVIKVMHSQAWKDLQRLIHNNTK